MKAIICEMCNSQDMIKQDGFFVCQSCGTRYSVEEAKKLMVEIESPIKIDNSDYVQRYLQNARRAMGKEDWPEVEKYYNMVEQNDPTNIEAIFYSAYGKAKAALSDNDIYKRQAIFKTLTNSVSILDDNYDISKEAELREILEMITKDVISVFGSSFVYTETKNQYGTVTNDNKHMTYQLFINLAVELVTTLSNIIAKFPAEQHKDVLYIFKLRLHVADFLSKQTTLTAESRKHWMNRCISMEAEIKKLDPSYTLTNYQARIEAMEAEAQQASKNAVGCFIVAIIVIGVVLGLIIAGVLV